MNTKPVFTIPLYIIAAYFILSGIGTILGIIATASLSFPQVENFLDGFRFMYVSLPGIQGNDPFIAAVINAIPIYNDFFIYAKDVLIIVSLLLAGYLLLKMKKLGLYLGLFITLFGLVVGTTYGFRHSPIEYVQNIFGGALNYGINDLSWTVMVISFLITLLTPIFLLINRKQFTK